MGKQALPCALGVRFQNGKVELMTANQVAPILCEEGIEMPEQQVAFATVIAKTLQQLPPAWVLNTTDKLHAALRSLMPSGNFRKTEITLTVQGCLDLQVIMKLLEFGVDVVHHK